MFSLSWKLLLIKGLIKQETIDRSVMRVLKLKEQLGLFDERLPTVSVPDQKQFQESATRLAEEAIVLLKMSKSYR